MRISAAALTISSKVRGTAQSYTKSHYFSVFAVRQLSSPCAGSGKGYLPIHCYRQFASMPPTANNKLDVTPRVVYGPSGVGKGTIIHDVKDNFPDIIGHSVSHTTRQPRPGEQDGKAYHFVDVPTFKRLIDEGAFIEHAIFNKTHYGTSWDAVKAVKDEGKIAILDIEIEGVKQLRANSDFPAKFLYLGPPSREELERRLRGRGTDSDEHIKSRLQQAEVEMAYAEADGADDDRLINDDLETTKRRFRAWLGLSTSQ